MKICVMMSGGLDSTTMMHLYSNRHDVIAIGFDYGQRHNKELAAARQLCEEVNVPFRVIKLPTVFTDSALVSGEPVPRGESKRNIVPNRNMVMLSTATAYAIQEGYDAVAFGANFDDVSGFPDCGMGFIAAMSNAMQYCYTRPIKLLTPWMDKMMTKAQVYSKALELGVPVDKTWSCYEGGAEPCGTCGACVIRDKARLNR